MSRRGKRKMKKIGIMIGSIIVIALIIVYGAYEFNYPDNKNVKEAVVPIPTKETETKEVKNNNIGLMKVSINNDRLRIAFKYKDDTDMWIDFAKGGVNSIFGISNIYLYANSEKEVSDDLSKSANLFKSTGTDWISPYKVKAIANGNENTTSFTGGWHGFDGDANGSPTAKTESFSFEVDGKKIEDNNTVVGSEVDITVTNLIQGYNTKEADGNGREIIKEIVKYKIKNGKIEVNNEIEALEDLIIESYYGLQTVNQGNDNEIYYANGDSTTWKNANKEETSSGQKLSYPDVDRFNLRSSDGNHNLIAWIDRSVGLGDLKDVSDGQSVAFTSIYGKSYFNLIRDELKTIKVGEKLTWRGGYEFNYGKSLVE